ncbi:MAG: transketolase family protein [Christensenellaceae bacterium]|jgi:transketolase
MAKLLKENVKCNLGDTLVSWLSNTMKENKDIYYMDCDLCGALGSSALVRDFPTQAINCGIMEANMIGVAAGLSLKGKVPFVHSFGTFASRRVADQVFLSGCYNKANIKILGSDPGITAQQNGGTHMPFEDMGVYRSFAEMTILDIADSVLLQNLLPKIAKEYGVMYIRFPRKGTECYYDENNEFTIGKAKLLREGSDVTIIACGVEVIQAIKAAAMLAEQGVSARVVDMFTIKPVDKEIIIESAIKTGAIVTAENHNIIGGLGSAVAEVLSENAPCILERIGVKEKFGQVGSRKYLSEVYGLTHFHIAEACKRVIRKKTRA